MSSMRLLAQLVSLVLLVVIVMLTVVPVYSLEVLAVHAHFLHQLHGEVPLPHFADSTTRDICSCSRPRSGPLC